MLIVILSYAGSVDLNFVLLTAAFAEKAQCSRSNDILSALYAFSAPFAVNKIDAIQIPSLTQGVLTFRMKDGFEVDFSRVKALFETRCHASCEETGAEPGKIGPNRPFKMNVNTT